MLSRLTRLLHVIIADADAQENTCTLTDRRVGAERHGCHPIKACHALLRGKRKKKECPNLASGHHRIMDAAQWDARDDGFKQGH